MKKTQQELLPPNLVILKSEAKHMLKIQMSNGEELLKKKFDSETDYNDRKNEQEIWTGYNVEMLTRIFENKYYVEEYENSTRTMFVTLNASLSNQIVS